MLNVQVRSPLSVILKFSRSVILILSTTWGGPAIVMSSRKERLEHKIEKVVEGFWLCFIQTRRNKSRSNVSYGWDVNGWLLWCIGLERKLEIHEGIRRIVCLCNLLCKSLHSTFSPSPDHSTLQRRSFISYSSISLSLYSILHLHRASWQHQWLSSLARTLSALLASEVTSIQV